MSKPSEKELARRQRLGDSHRTHGMTGTPTWKTWMSMRARCSQQSHTYFSMYGGRGIAVCDRWANSFENFLADMGERPEGMTLDRIDSNGNYEPGNCRWATRVAQGRNKRSTLLSMEDAEAIRDRRARGDSLLVLGSAYGVSISTISAICVGKRWRAA